MPFNPEDCFLEPKRTAMHIWDGAAWQEWTGTLTVGDIEIGAVEGKNYNTDDRWYISPAHRLFVHESPAMTVVSATGAAAVAMVVNPAVEAKIEQMIIHLSAAGAAGDLTVTLDNGTGAAYDAILLTQSMVSVVDYVWIPARSIYLKATDHLDIVWANASNRTYGIEVVWSAH